MNAEIVTIGTELLLGEIVNTNAQYLSARLAELGINVYYHTTVGDNLPRMVDTLARAAARTDLVVITGGLGPTEDDLTRQAVAQVTGLSLKRSDVAVAHVENYLAQTGRRPTPNNYRQTEFPEGSILLDNPRGTALGFLLSAKNTTFLCMPGVPQELYVVFDAALPHLRQRLLSGETGVIESVVLKVCGIGESALEEKLRDLSQGTNPTLALYAKLGEVRVRITAKAPDAAAAQALIAPVAQEVRNRLGTMVYGSGDDQLETVVARLLLARHETLAVAESLTGGLVGHRLTNVPGSSGFLQASLVTYSNAAKHQLLGVPWEILSTVGPVSAETAPAMAQGVRERLQTQWGLGVTGIAGPGSDETGKPVGLVYVALAGKTMVVEEHHFSGEREQIKYRSSQAALDLLRRHLL